MGRRESKDRRKVRIVSSILEEKRELRQVTDWEWFFFLRTTGGGKGPEYHNEEKRELRQVIMLLGLSFVSKL